MQNGFTSLLMSLSCLLPSCLGMVGLGVLMVWVFIRARQPKDATALAADRQRIQSRVEALMGNVRPWRPEALADLRTDRDLRWGRFGRNFRMRGLIAASSRDKERTWAAFAGSGRRVYRGPLSFHGQAHARTTAQSLEFHARPTDEVAIQVDGRPLGSLQPDGTLLDASGQPIGQAAPPTNEQPTCPVTLHKRLVAHLANPFHGGLFRRRGPRPPAVEITALDVTPDERDWLLALALWRVIDRAAAQAESSWPV